MKRNNWIVVLSGILLIALGFALGRVTVGSGNGESTSSGGTGGLSDHSSLRPAPGTTGRRTAGKHGGKPTRSPAASIRQVARKLEFSPMVSMDFDAYEAIRWMGPEEARMALDELDQWCRGPGGSRRVARGGYGAKINT